MSMKRRRSKISWPRAAAGLATESPNWGNADLRASNAKAWKTKPMRALSGKKPEFANIRPIQHKQWRNLPCPGSGNHELASNTVSSNVSGPS